MLHIRHLLRIVVRFVVLFGRKGVAGIALLLLLHHTPVDPPPCPLRAPTWLWCFQAAIVITGEAALPYDRPFLDADGAMWFSLAGTIYQSVSYTHLTLPTICSV